MFSEQNRGIACRGPRPPFRRDVLLDRALQKMRQEESGCLKFSVNVRRRLSTSGYPHSSQQIGRFSAEFVARRVERSEEHTSELQSRGHLVCRLLLEKKKQGRTGED